MTVRLDDMRIFACLAEVSSFTKAAEMLDLPKQTVSRRVAALEEALGMSLVHRTTRAFRLTDVGAAYGVRCAEVVRLAEEAHAEVRESETSVRGCLRVTADPLFGETFLPGILSAYVEAHPEVRLDIVLTQRKVDLVEEGFDVAFRVGAMADSTLVAIRLGPARVVYCASPAYLTERGVPETPEALEDHDLVLLAPEIAPTRWAFRGPDGPRWVRVEGRVRVNHLGLARQAAESGLGVANLPAFACQEAFAHGRLREVLTEDTIEFGGVFLVRPAGRVAPARVRAFFDLVQATFSKDEL